MKDQINVLIDELNKPLPDSNSYYQIIQNLKNILKDYCYLNIIKNPPKVEGKTDYF